MYDVTSMPTTVLAMNALPQAAALSLRTSQAVGVAPYTNAIWVNPLTQYDECLKAKQDQRVEDSLVQLIGLSVGSMVPPYRETLIKLKGTPILNPSPKVLKYAFGVASTKYRREGRDRGYNSRRALRALRGRAYGPYGA